MLIICVCLLRHWHKRQITTEMWTYRRLHHPESGGSMDLWNYHNDTWRRNAE